MDDKSKFGDIPLFRFFQINKLMHPRGISSSPKTPGFHYFGYMLRGYGELGDANGSFRINEGEMVYIPEGRRYWSGWHGEPAEFYSIPFLFYQFQVPRLPLQRLCPPTSLRERLDRMYEDFRLDETGAYRAFGDFCALYGEVLPLLRRDVARQQVLRVQPALVLMELSEESYTVGQLAALCGMGESRFFSVFRQEMGCTPVEYKNRMRIRQACVLLTSTSMSSEEIAWQLHFSSAAYFRRVFLKITGQTPGEYRTLKGI